MRLQTSHITKYFIEPFQRNRNFSSSNEVKAVPWDLKVLFSDTNIHIFKASDMPSYITHISGYSGSFNLTLTDIQKVL